MLDRARVVLVRPSGPTNVGSVARVMANFALGELVLVAPRCDPLDAQALAYASHGADVLRKARTVMTIAEALAGCVRSYATTSKRGLYRRQAAMTARQAGVRAAQDLAAGPVALVFGPERHGLTQKEQLLFDVVVTIPADDGYPVLNLAAAAAIVCYELRMAWLERSGPVRVDSAEPRATDERKQILLARLFEALEQIGFFGGQQNPDHLKYAIRRVIGRTTLTVNEADILIGMAQQILWYARHHGAANGHAPEQRSEHAAGEPKARRHEGMTRGGEG